MPEQRKACGPCVAAIVSRGPTAVFPGHCREICTAPECTSWWHGDLDTAVSERGQACPLAAGRRCLACLVDRDLRRPRSPGRCLIYGSADLRAICLVYCLVGLPRVGRAISMSPPLQHLDPTGIGVLTADGPLSNAELRAGADQTPDAPATLLLERRCVKPGPSGGGGGGLAVEAEAEVEERVEWWGRWG
jgi:hypothetical protein